MLLNCQISRLASFWQGPWWRKGVARSVRQSQAGKAGSLSGRQVCGLSSLSFEHAQGVVSGPAKARLAGSKVLQGVFQAWWQRVGQQVLHLSEGEIK